MYLCICVLVYLWCGNRVEVRTSVGENKRTGMPHYGLATEGKPRPTLCHAPRIHCCLLRSQLSLTCQHMFTLITWNTSCHICHLSVVIFVTKIPRLTTSVVPSPPSTDHTSCWIFCPGCLRNLDHSVGHSRKVVEANKQLELFTKTHGSPTATKYKREKTIWQNSINN